jgi:putative aldouronate transport system permease protein
MHNESLRWKIFNVINILFMLLLSIVILYPYVNVLAISLNDNTNTAYTGIMLIPQYPTLMNFKALFVDSNIQRSALVTICRVLIGVSLTVFVEFCAAYALSRKQMKGKRQLTMLLMIPMYISGGLIPSYLLYSSIHLINNPLVYVLPGAFAFFDFILMRTFLRTIPDSLEESAKLDGANHFQIMTRIMLPPCAPIIATVTLFNAVNHWNDWTTTLYFITSNKWSTLQFELQRILREQARLSQLVQNAIMEGAIPQQVPSTSTGLRSAQIIVTTLPIILIYPYLQKYFIKGMLIGGVKE